jgi:hypothetical protein
MYITLQPRLAECGQPVLDRCVCFQEKSDWVGLGKARTRRDQASRRSERARTQGSIPNAMCRVWWVKQKDSSEDKRYLDYESRQM